MRLFVYDHCPYCVRTRIIFGLKNIAYELVVLPNDDEATPISMIGAKVCPILEKSDGSFIGESMDIVTYIDNIDGSPILKPSAKTERLTHWVNDTSMLLRKLLYPRWVNSPLGEFQTTAAKQYFINKKDASIGGFDNAVAQTDELKATLEKYLVELAEMLHNTKSVNESLSYDDIDVFGRLRGVTLIKDLVIPEKVRAYIDYFAQASGIPLYDDIAC